MTKPFGPLLAAAIQSDSDLGKIRFPVLVSPKIDGIRCLLRNKKAITRTIKEIPNISTQQRLKHLLSVWSSFDGFDGELTLGDPKNVTNPTLFNATQSAVMSFDGDPELTYWVFDWYPTSSETSLFFRGFIQRLQQVNELLSGYGNLGIEKFHIQAVPHTQIDNLEELAVFEKECLDLGYEGIMIRSMDGRYKYGRSTLKEGILLKMKRSAITGAVTTTENEARICGFKELMHNDNPQTRNALGLSKRSSHKANMRPGNTLGAFEARVVNGPLKGKLFDCGTGNGLTHELRQKIWDNREEYHARYFTFSHQLVGALDKPRFPVFERFRDVIDIVFD